MQSARSRAESQVALRAIPQARAAMHALLAVEGRHPGGAGSNRLARADLHTRLGRATPAHFRVQEMHMIRQAGHRLHLTAKQQRVLMAHQQLAVIRNGRPPAAIHQSVVARCTFGAALGRNAVERFFTPQEIGDLLHLTQSLSA